MEHNKVDLQELSWEQHNSYSYYKHMFCQQLYRNKLLIMSNIFYGKYWLGELIQSNSCNAWKRKAVARSVKCVFVRITCSVQQSTVLWGLQPLQPETELWWWPCSATCSLTEIHSQGPLLNLPPAALYVWWRSACACRCAGSALCWGTAPGTVYLKNYISFTICSTFGNRKSKTIEV